MKENKNKIEKAAQRLHPIDVGNRYSFKSGAEWMNRELIESIESLIIQNEDDFDRGKGKYILRQFIEEQKK